MSDRYSKLNSNVFLMEFEEKIIWRHIVDIKLLDISGKNFSSSSRGSRHTKQRDNFLIFDKIFEQHSIEQFGSIIGNAYDGAKSLFALEKLNINIRIGKEEAVTIWGISEYLIDTLHFLNGVLEISCTPDCVEPSFNQVKSYAWQDDMFKSYLQTIVSQEALRSGDYLSQSNGLFINVSNNIELRSDWAEDAKLVHVGFRNVGDIGALSLILVMDPKIFQCYAPVPLDQMLLHACESRGDHRSSPIKENPQLMKSLKLLVKDMECHPCYADIKEWGSTPIVVRDLDFDAPMNMTYVQQHPGLRSKDLPAALCGLGPIYDLIPLETLMCIQFQVIDDTVAKEFALIKRSIEPAERWKQLGDHFNMFRFGENSAMISFGVHLHNHKFKNTTQIMEDPTESPVARQINVVNAMPRDERWIMPPSPGRRVTDV